MTDGKTGIPGPIGPTIETLATGDRPQPMPACGTCPKAMWYWIAKRLRAFCQELRHITWVDGDSEPILLCDGREAALMPPDGHGV